MPRKDMLLLRMLFTLAVVIAYSHPSAARDSDLESWYTYWGLGYASNTYPNGFFVNKINDLSGIDHIALALDMLGFYWPRGDRTLVGGIVNASVDAYSDTGGLTFAELDIHHYLYALSAMHFLTHKIGRGPFVRADVGLARRRSELVIGEVKEGFKEKWESGRTSDFGTGFLLGGGYGIPLTSGTRLLINANFSLRHIEGYQYSSVGITLNGLF